MKNLERKDILNVKKHTKNKSVLDKTEVEIYNFNNTYIKTQLHKK